MYSLNLKRIFIAFLFILISGSAARSAPSVIVLNSDESLNQLLPIQQDILRTIKSRLSRIGFNVLDEKFFLKEFGFQKNTIQRDRLLDSSNQLRSAGARFQLIFIETILQNKNLRISAEVYSSAAQSFIFSWSMPVTELRVSNNCNLNCIRLTANAQIEQTADGLADAISKLLELPTGATDKAGNDIAKIEIELLDLSPIEKIQLVDLMTNEFPHFYRVSKVRTNGPRHTMTYHSSAPMNKLHDWLIVSLKQIGLDPVKDVQIVITNDKIYIKKMNIFSPKKNIGNSARFN